MHFDHCPCLSLSIVLLIDDLNFFQEADSGELVFVVSKMAMDFLAPNIDDFFIQLDSLHFSVQCVGNPGVPFE